MKLFPQVCPRRSHDQCHDRLKVVICCLQMNIIAGGFYDSVMLYAQALNETMTPAGDRPPRKLVNERMWNRTFHGEFGERWFLEQKHVGRARKQGKSIDVVWSIVNQHKIYSFGNTVMIWRWEWACPLVFLLWCQLTGSLQWLVHSSNCSESPHRLWNPVQCMLGLR